MSTDSRQPPGAEGQLWEECPHCGTEPVWMPHMVCVRCWPTPQQTISEPRHPSERFDKNDEPKGDDGNGP